MFYSRALATIAVVGNGTAYVKLPLEGPKLQAAPDAQLLTVAELAAELRACVERGCSDVWVQGEISNLRVPASGHSYFTLKDEHAQVRCVMWRSNLRFVPVAPRNGLRVIVRGSASVYEARGELQFVVRAMRPAGEGALQQAFLALKRKLADEGLFDERHKKPLPALPAHIGIVTSGDGAALHDITSILRRRFPISVVSVYAVRVQGAGAADQVASAIRAFAAAAPPERPDLLIVGRGGGSVEDLWAFNEEVVARAIFACPIPVVSAVGHETDFSISDFVADVRAATPSMAAELAAPNQAELRRRIAACLDRIRGHAAGVIDGRRRHVVHLIRSHVFNRPIDRLRQQQLQVDDLQHRLHREILVGIQKRRARIDGIDGRLALLDPRRPLERGYAVVERNGTRVRRGATLVSGEDVTLQFVDARRTARIRS